MTRDEKMLIFKIAERADKNGLLMSDRLSLIMDIEHTHDEVTLKLEELLNADEMNFTHDIVGIQNNMNRKTGKLENCFLPRYSK